MREPEFSAVTSLIAPVSADGLHDLGSLPVVRYLERKTVIFRWEADNPDSCMHYFYIVAVKPMLPQCQYKSLLLQKYSRTRL
jgi:hypothetical protein